MSSWGRAQQADKGPRLPGEGGNSGGNGQGEQRKGLGAVGAELQHSHFAEGDLNGTGNPRKGQHAVPNKRDGLVVQSCSVTHGGEPKGKLVPGAAGKGWGSLAVWSTPGGAWGEQCTWLKHRTPLRCKTWPLRRDGKEGPWPAEGKWRP